MVVHNGIITNYREIKEYLKKKGHNFEASLCCRSVRFCSLIFPLHLVGDGHGSDCEAHPTHPQSLSWFLISAGGRSSHPATGWCPGILPCTYAVSYYLNTYVFQEGAFALAFKSSKFPGQLVATRRGSPLLVGIKSNSRLQTNYFPVLLSRGEYLLYVWDRVRTGPCT